MKDKKKKEDPEKLKKKKRKKKIEDPEQLKKRKARKKRERRRFFIKFAILITIGLILWFAVFCFIPQHGNQMFPVVKDGDLLITLKIKPTYQPSAVVGYQTPDKKHRIGRIVAMQGEKVNVTEEGRLEINGTVMSEEIFYPTDLDEKSIKFPYTVPKNSYFILNDHRSETDDSREYGAIKKNKLLGSAFLLFRRRSF